MNREMTFWDLIEKNKIEVPIIQRDYAQGRIEDKVNSIRENFITTLLKSLSDPEKFTHLGFIYGKIEGKDKFVEKQRNEEAIKNMLNAVKGYAQHLEIEIDPKILNIKQEVKNSSLPTFIPLDGQQRLTTLFLVHRYFVQFVVDDSKDELLKILERFTYKTRKSSLAFCKALCDPENQLSTKALSGKSIAAEIKKSTWFLNVWLRDSTVRGMLVTLDEIHKQSIDLTDKPALTQTLLKDQKIKFDFLDLDELNQTDELYVKMNARGVQLTEFEHFKAWLQNHVKETPLLKESISEVNWKTKIDKDWLDLFWRVNKNSYYIDDIIFNAFKQISLLEFIASNESIDEGLVKTVRENNYLSFKEFEEYQFYNDQSLNFLFESLNTLTDSGKIEKYRKSLDDIAIFPFLKKNAFLDNYFIQGAVNPDLPETVFYYSFLLFIVNEPELEKEERELAFKNWMRICRNLIFNTYVQNPRNFIDAIQSIKKLSEFKSNIFGAINNPGIKIDFFNKKQLDEERLKVELIETKPEWKQAIDEAENHTYFQGKIGFLLDFSRDENEYNLDQFIFYSCWAQKLYGDEIRNDSRKLLERSLLAIGDYLPQVKSNYTFCLPGANSLRDRRDNWHRFFDSDKIEFLKELINQLANDSIGEIEKDLYKVIDSYDSDNWRKFVINCPSTISYCKQGFLRYNSDSDINLLETSRAYGRHAELRTYYFYIKEFEKDQIEPFKKEFYFENPKNQYKYSCIRLKDWEYQRQKYQLEISFHNGSYNIDLHHEERLVIGDSDLLGALKQLRWKFNNDNSFVKVTTSQVELSKELNTILSELKNIAKVEEFVL